MGKQFWPGALKSYYWNTKISFCPAATKLWYTGSVRQTGVATGAYTGAKLPFAAWGPYGNDKGWAIEGSAGSYGMNAYVANMPSGVPSPVFPGRPTNDYWRSVNERNANTIPLFLDCQWMVGWPTSNDNPPRFNGETISVTGADEMKRFCFARHGNFTESLFLDLSARKVELKELWTLKWHRSYNTASWYTKAGGVKPGDWPAWMRSLKDY